MARARHGLGQGLEALVTGTAGSNWANFAPQPAPEASTAMRWEYAQLKQEKRRKKRLRVVFSNPNSLVKPREVRLPRISRWSALGLMGSEGWELTGLDRGRCLFKRQAREG